jgi:hypothetical protein
MKAAALLLALPLALSACASHSPSSSAAATASPSASTQTAINNVCPMTGEPLDPAVTVAYKGQPVGFCCSECVEDWRKLTDDQRDARLKKSM